MPNEDLIYRITRAVYDRVGTAADEQTIEQLVTDIYREVQGVGINHQNLTGTKAVTPQSSEGSSERMVISVFGLDGSTIRG